MAVLDEEDRQIGQVIDRLMGQFPEVARDAVIDTVEAARGRFLSAPIRDFVPLFVERDSKEKLANLAVS